MPGSRLVTVEVLPSGDACGAEIRGVDLARPLDEATVAAILQALVAHGMVVFRDQSVSPARQVELTALLGEVDLYSLSEYCLGEQPEVLLVSNIQEDGRNIGLADAGATWHTDSSYLAIPPFATLLHAIEVPVAADGRVLGDTLFTSAAAAYDALDLATKERLEHLYAVHSYTAKHAARARLGRSDRNPPKAEEAARLAPVAHPVVRRHPISGRPALYVTAGECIAIPGIDEMEASALIDRLTQRIIDPIFHHRHQWEAGDFVIWDNCQLQHLAIKDYDLPLRRLMHRTQVEGTKPI